MSMDAEVELQHAGVYGDMAPRNIICSGAHLQTRHPYVSMIDFHLASVLPLLGTEASYESEPCRVC